MEKSICPICGEPTRSYMGNTRRDKLCGKHADALKKGDIKISEEGLFIDAKTLAVLNNPDVTPKKVKEAKCISCGNNVIMGDFFCKECYFKYKDKNLLIKIKKCVDIEILDDSYEGAFTCDDGHVVKSKSEMIIDNYLFERGIPHAYEKAFPIDADPKHDLHPDFCLPNYLGANDDVFIEHFGYNEENIKYWNSKKYKIAKYKEAGITLICTNEKDMNDPKTSLKRKLDFYEKNIINYE